MVVWAALLMLTVQTLPDQPDQLSTALPPSSGQLSCTTAADLVCVCVVGARRRCRPVTCFLFLDFTALWGKRAKCNPSTNFLKFMTACWPMGFLSCLCAVDVELESMHCNYRHLDVHQPLMPGSGISGNVRPLSAPGRQHGAGWITLQMHHMSSAAYRHVHFVENRGAQTLLCVQHHSSNATIISKVMQQESLGWCGAR